jgi:hypothetical protein
VDRRTLILTDQEKQELERLRDHEPRPYMRERAAALLKIHAGQSPYQVARSGLFKPRDTDTVYSWLNRYQEEGIKGLVMKARGKRRQPP